MFQPAAMLVGIQREFTSFALPSPVLSLILVNAGFNMGLFAVWILNAYFSSIPHELEQAAMVDGTTRLGAVVRITLPLAMPGVITAVIFTFIQRLERAAGRADAHRRRAELRRAAHRGHQQLHRAVLHRLGTSVRRVGDLHYPGHHPVRVHRGQGRRRSDRGIYQVGSHRAMSFATTEIASQPDMWMRAGAMATDASVRAALPADGERVARSSACGTSYNVAQALRCAAASRSGHGETDAFAASEFPRGRNYDRVIAVCRSGTTTEMIDLVGAVAADTRTTVLSTAADLPVPRLAQDIIALGFADEQSVVADAVRDERGGAMACVLGPGSDPSRRRRRRRAGQAGTVDVRRAVHIPRHRLDHRPRSRGGVEAARGGPTVDRVVRRDGVIGTSRSASPTSAHRCGCSAPCPMGSPRRSWPPVRSWRRRRPTRWRCWCGRNGSPSPSPRRRASTPTPQRALTRAVILDEA